MIYLLAHGDHADATLIVQSALERSCGHGQVQLVGFAQWRCLQAQNSNLLSVIINPPELWAAAIAKSLNKPGSKNLIFGSMPPTLANALQASVLPIDDSVREAVKCTPAATRAQTNSPISIEYENLAVLGEVALKQRACLRYDFTDEWNNLGYGAVRADETIWSLSQIVQLPRENLLASLKLQSQTIGAYAGLWLNESIASAIMWFNRPVGPVDSHEWHLVEKFFSDVGYPSIACQPVLSEIPYGHDAAVTMRLDCDEDVESARPLWQAYQNMSVPFSLALHARVLTEERHHSLPRDVLENGGALLSHTATHAPDWGGSYAAAFEEGWTSAAVIQQSTGYRVRYAVSPFHQTPVYARAGLADAGYEGCIGGLIRNDYDFLMARSGTPPGGVKGFIGHSQQCMLHGDCMLDGNDPLLIYKQAFAAAKASGTFFGYLDHPFSERYQYGWESERQRINMHMTFVEHIRAQGSVLFTHENDALDYLHDRAAIKVSTDARGFNICLPLIKRSHLKQSVLYAGNRYVIPEQGLRL